MKSPTDEKKEKRKDLRDEENSETCDLHSGIMPPVYGVRIC